MTAAGTGRTPSGPAALLLGGVLAVGVGLGLDTLGVDRRGFGWEQATLAAAGALLAALGLVRARTAARAGTRPLAEAVPVLVIAAQLLGLVLVIRLFHIENPAFSQRVAPLVLVGYLGHHLLPPRWRLAGFVGLSFAAIAMVFGARGSVWLVGTGLALIGLCHLPVRFGWRVAAVLVAAVALAAARAEWWHAPWPGAVWPILGSMFMFRLIVYLYDLRHARVPPGLAQRLAYFFLLPNVVFPLFPVVDFATFQRTYFDEDAVAIHQRGIQWMARGLGHLIAYRVVYQYLTLSPAEVTDGAALVRYMIANFLLYLRVSGLFHLSVGILHLFGFRLPATHRFFYLASGFTDFWRRINIYWKDFCQKLVYLPVWFWLKPRGETRAVVVATLLVFVATWFFHSYQWFWLLGIWLWSWTDAFFWAILGAILVFSTLREQRLSRERRASAADTSWRATAQVALRTALTFAVICTLWTLWTAPTLGDAAGLVRASAFGRVDLLLVVGVLAAVGLAAAAVHRLRAGRVEVSAQAVRPWRAMASAGLPLAIVSLLVWEPIAGQFSGPVRGFLRDVTLPGLSRADAETLQRGYYERIVGVNRFTSELWERFSQAQRQDWLNIDDVGGMQPRDDFLRKEVRPYLAVWFKGAAVRTNRWGMRDDDVSPTVAPGTRRVALLGQSYVFGTGVADNETFESLLEARLARDAVRSGQRVELLNFAVPGYALDAQLALLGLPKVWEFHPEAVLLIGHPRDAVLLRNDLVNAVSAGAPIPWQPVREIIGRAGITPTTLGDDARRRLAPYLDTLVTWTMARIAAAIRERGAVPLWTLVGTPGERTDSTEIGKLEAAATAAGFVPLRIGNPFAGWPVDSIVIRPWDLHPNRLGHQLIADSLYAAWVRTSGLPGGPPPTP